jgi:uncharacterized membrane protein YraQ (UPF0718 family)
MLNHILEIVNFIIEAFVHIWPYLLITIPLAVAIRLSGASKYIKRVFEVQPMAAILLATAVGAFSPLCSCGVIPVIATLLIGGVPLAPVMSFWIASPSMDPEVFFLSVSTIGWELAVWRLVGTLVLSLSAGFITHFVMQKGWLGQDILRHQQSTSVQSTWVLLKNGWQNLSQRLSQAWQYTFEKRVPTLATEVTCCPAPATAELTFANTWQPAVAEATPAASCSSDCGPTDSGEGDSCRIKPASFRQRLLQETWDATTMVAKFMLLTFFLEAIIILYIPSEWIGELLGQKNQWAILTAALLGVPVFTSNLTALPLVSGLLAQGMNSGAGLAFLIAGPTTTLPAMVAVWGLASRRVFALYVLFSLVGAVVLGYVYSIVAGLLAF